MRRRESLKVNAELNLVNIIDVIFAILVVFMITAPLDTQGVKVDLPKAKAGAVEEKKSVRVTVTRQREVLIDDRPSSTASFERDFRAAFDGDPATAVMINADRGVPYGLVVELVASAQRAGARRVGFLTDPSGRP